MYQNVLGGLLLTSCIASILKSVWGLQNLYLPPHSIGKYCFFMIFAIYVQILKSKLQAKAGTSLWFVDFYTDIKEHLLAGFDKDLQKKWWLYPSPTISQVHHISRYWC